MRFIDFVDKGAALFPDVPLIVECDQQWSYREMQTLSRRIGTALVAAGVGPDTAVSTFSPNGGLMTAAEYGIFRAGAVWLPLNVRNSFEENLLILQRMKSQFLFFHSYFEEKIASIQAEAPGIRGFVCLDRESRYGPSLMQWLEGHGTQGPWHEKGPHDPIVRYCTSGTTGLPKGVDHTDSSYEAMISSLQIVMPYDVRPIHIVAAPLTHAAGRLDDALRPIGGTTIVLPGPDPLAILEAIEKYRATTVFLPPTLIYMMLAHPRVMEFDYSSLRYMVYGAAPMSVEKLRQATTVFGNVMCQLYGQTESLMCNTCLTVSDHVKALSTPGQEFILSSAGHPGPLCMLEILDDDGNILPRGEKGEIAVRTELTMRGYFENPEATREVTKNGWHCSGDVGVIDEQGYVHIVDRKKDMIISGGFNVYPGEVEQVIWAHAAIQDCAVIGIPDEKWGEAVTAVVELKAGCPLDEGELIQWCKDRVGSVKAPKSVIVVAALPRSGVGKVLKKELRAQYWKDAGRAI